MKKRFYKSSYTLGYNSREDAESIPFESCQSLVNARPGQTPFPREGIEAWGTDDQVEDIQRIFPFKTREENYLLYFRQGSSNTEILYRVEGGGEVVIDTAALITEQDTLTFLRIKDSIYILSDSGTHYILSFANAAFTLRNANLARPPIALSAVSAGVGTAIPAGKFISLSATLVNRDDAAALTGPGDPALCDLDTVGYAPGLLESLENIDERIVFENASGDTVDVDIEALINNTAPLDPQATHLRLYMTDAQASKALAEGSEHKWFADLPLIGANANGVPLDPGPVDAYEYTLTFDEGQVAGALDTLKVTGYDAIPPCRFAIYHQGRIWVGDAATSGESPGRWYYSELPLDLEAPQKWASMFLIGTYFKDTALDNADTAAGIGISRNDIVFVMRESVSSLRDGDPDFEPQLIDSNNGTKFPNSLTAIGRDLAYLGNNGPIVIAGREAVPLEQFTAGEVWPLAKGVPGYFFTLADPEKVQGFYFRETFFLADEVKIIGMFMPQSGDGRGPYQVVPASPTIKIGQAAVFDRETCIIVSTTDAKPVFHQFLKTGLHTDLGASFFIKSKSMMFLFDARNRDQAGELYDILVSASFTDEGRFDVFASSNYFRHRFDTTYDETPSTDDYSDTGMDPTWRKILQMGFPEGLVGFGFEIEWVKEFASPYDFECSGFTLRAKPVGGHPIEYVSRDLGSGPIENGPDIEFWYGFDYDALEEEDRSLNLRTLSYEDVGGAATRTYLVSLPPSGGQILSGAGPASGYKNASWTGITALGVRGISREYVLRAIALTGTVWLEQGGDGTSFFGVKITPLGALVLAVYTASVKRTYTSANGVIATAPAAGTDYTIQVTLTADMLTCRFYVALRTAAAALLPDPTIAVLAAGGPGIYEPGTAKSYLKELFDALSGALWSGGTVAAGRLTASTIYIGSTLTIGAADTLSVSGNMRLASNGSYAGGSLARNGFTFTLPSAEVVTVYVGALQAFVNGPIRVYLQVGAGPISSSPLPGTMTPSLDYDYRLSVEITRASLAIYVDGALHLTHEFGSVVDSVATFTVVAIAHNNIAPTVDDVYFAGIDNLGTLGNGLDLVEIPTYHKLMPGATYGISHARGLRIAKSPIRAAAFHAAMRRKTK